MRKKKKKKTTNKEKKPKKKPRLFVQRKSSGKFECRNASSPLFLLASSWRRCHPGRSVLLLLPHTATRLWADHGGAVLAVERPALPQVPHCQALLHSHSVAPQGVALRASCRCSRRFATPPPHQQQFWSVTSQMNPVRTFESVVALVCGSLQTVR